MADRPVKSHDGSVVTLSEALASCEPARHSIDAAIETIRDVGGSDIDVVPALTKHIERMGEKAQTNSTAPQHREAEKK